MIVKHFICIIVLLISMPITSAVGLLIFGPENWGGKLTVINVVGLSLFGLLSVPLWLTFIPTLIATPVIMSRLVVNDIFHTLPVWKFILFFIGFGALAGTIILFPSIYLCFSKGSYAILFNWLGAGVFSGSITFTIVALLYRCWTPQLSQ